MNRGIIQESDWTKKGTFIRKKIDQYGLANVKQRGRIWRLVHENFKRGPKPKMLDVAASKLIQYLDHPNGWWRDNAQKQIILLNDKSVVAELREIVSGNKGTSALGRLHALWTLEGLEAVDKNIIYTALKDVDPQIRRAAVWISEPMLKQNNEEVSKRVAPLVDDQNFDVLTQLVLSFQSVNTARSKEIVNRILAKHPNNEMLFAAKGAVEKNEDLKRYGEKLGQFAASERKLIMEGALIYKSICGSCHGGDGKGLPTQAAPPLVKAKYLIGNKNYPIRILLNGLKGEVEGKTYSSEMPAMKYNTDEWIASVLSYSRYEFGAKNLKTTIVKPEEVNALRKQHAGRADAWTVDELEILEKQSEQKRP
jgi:mono/diheme cytochrome c family protein